jgi:hypothetical protein
MNPRKPARSATQDELLLARPAVAREEPWRALRILGDFVEGFETLAGLGPAVAVFGSTRVSRPGTAITPPRSRPGRGSRGLAMP